MSVDKLKILIMQSALPKKDKEYLINLFSNIQDNQAKDITDLIEEKPELLIQLLEVYRLKEEALINKDETSWKKIIEKEKELIKELDIVKQKTSRY